MALGEVSVDLLVACWKWWEGCLAGHEARAVAREAETMKQLQTWAAKPPVAGPKGKEVL